MSIVVLGGYGEIGRVIVIDLFETFNGEIIVAGRDEEKAKKFANSFKSKKVKWAKADINNQNQLESVLRKCSVVINSTQYNTNLDVMTAALNAGADYIDLGGLFHVTRKQLRFHNKFKSGGLTAVLGCGATPGITNVMAAYGVRFFDKIDSIHVQFADKDYTKYNIPFVVPYSMNTIFDEFSKDPAVFANGKFTFVSPLSGSEEIKFPSPVNNATCFYTLHSEVATFPLSFKSKGIKNCSFKGGFDKDFVDKVRFLIDTGLASEDPVNYKNSLVIPREFIAKMFNKFIPKKIKVNDVEFLRVEIIGKKDGQNKRLSAYCKAVSNKKWNIPAGSWDTGVPASIIAQMLIKGEINEKGVFASELIVPPRHLIEELKKRNMHVSIRNN